MGIPVADTSSSTSKIRRFVDLGVAVVVVVVVVVEGEAQDQAWGEGCKELLPLSLLPLQRTPSLPLLLPLLPLLRILQQHKQEPGDKKLTTIAWLSDG